MDRVGQPPDFLEVCGVMVVTVEVLQLLALPQVLGPCTYPCQVGVQL